MIVVASKGPTGDVSARILPKGEGPQQGEIAVELPEDTTLGAWAQDKTWDDTANEPREKTQAETDEEARQEALTRVASEAADSYTQEFVDPNDAIGFIASCLHKVATGEALAAEDVGALKTLRDGYEHGKALKQEIDTAPVGDLPDVHWDE